MPGSKGELIKQRAELRQRLEHLLVQTRTRPMMHELHCLAEEEMIHLEAEVLLIDRELGDPPGRALRDQRD